MEQQLKSTITNKEKLEKSLGGHVSSNVTDYSQVNIFDEIITTSENHLHDHAVVHIMGMFYAEDGTL